MTRSSGITNDTDARLARARHAQVGRQRLHHPDVLPPAARVFIFGAYKYPRELNWIVGVMLLLLGMLEGFTGYLLPFDQTAYWATVVGINLNATAPFLGPFLAQFLQGGNTIGDSTLLAVLRGPHAAAARRDRSPDRAAPLPCRPPRCHVAALVEDCRGSRARRRSSRGRPRGPHATFATQRGDPLVASRRVALRRAEHERYKEDVEREGKAFFPHAMFADTVMSFVVVSVIIGLAASGTSPPARPRRTSGGSARATRRRPTRGRRASSHVPTGSTTSSSTSSESSNGRKRS